jgi:hypothetical protein
VGLPAAGGCVFGNRIEGVSLTQALNSFLLAVSRSETLLIWTKGQLEVFLQYNPSMRWLKHRRARLPLGNFAKTVLQ